MDANLQNYIESFSRLRALVVGEAIIDSYLHGTAERICREAPAPIVAISHRENVPGGAANTAVNARSLGADVAFLSVVGDDHEGHLLRQALQDRGVSDSCLITQYGRRTLAKHRVVAGPQILVRFDEGSTEPVSAEVEARLVIRLRELFPRCDAVI